ncbi:tetraspanin-32 isoform X4 [Molossus molossus]|uniref:tetraspanin-32 isoform X4 n=1 Tax=Molossus molossus TaxID=27622 RepID=UPI0017460B53|nr:tetraspanin-32 isoform X4 [Molossus molossus]
MGPWSRVRMAKCQMLVTSFFVLLLGLLVATLAALTYFGAHFAVISRVSPEGSPFKAMHHWAFFTEISLAGLLTLGAVLSAAATVREAGGLMAGMEDALLDTFDLVYEQALRSSSGARWQELVAIQDTFLCCGKSSPPSLPGLAEADLCPGEEAGTQDCLQGIRGFLRTHGHIASTLTSVGLVSMVYAMLLSSFLRFAIHSGRSLDRRGTYALSPRAHGCQPQEPSFFRPSRGSPALLHRDDLLGPGGLSGGPRRLEDLCSCRRPAPETRHRPGPAPLARRPGGRAVPSAARGLPCLEEKPHHTSAMPCAWADTWGAVFEKFCLPHLVPLDIQTTWRMSPNCLQGFASFAEDPQP